MAKRCAEDVLPHDSPSKRCYRSLCSVDMQLQSVGPIVGGNLNPPSLLSLLGRRCRKRPYYVEEPECEEAAGGPHIKTTHCDIRKHAGNVLSVQISGNPQDRRSSNTLTSPKKRAREEGAGSEAVSVKPDVQADLDTNTEDWPYNSFQYWRVPLPELDLSLLEDANGHSQIEDKTDRRHYF
ncbi:putative protein C9orf40 -like protein [Channa argus]|uniref:Uncharacterized protein n=1 Tax=Channa argus TaxID=215402 RepID=A0A6G1Q1B8_CHAAH|nr:putative protein C9orf40 -like protein [Channa argus]KAK2902337.1 hypothetical protein Q8A73_012083 [Channa argus]